jgi:hypothetical protein
VARSRTIRALAIAGFSAVGAVAAHAGPAGLTNALWLAVAAAGALLGVSAIAATAVVATAHHRRAQRLFAGELTLIDGIDRAVDAPPFNLLVAAMLACQGAAHVMLILAGVAPHGGIGASLTLHVLLAIAGASLVSLLDRVMSWSARTLLRAALAALDRLVRRTSVAAGAPLGTPRSALRAGGVHGRAPPVMG